MEILRVSTSCHSIARFYTKMGHQDASHSIPIYISRTTKRMPEVVSALSLSVRVAYVLEEGESLS